MMLDSLDILLIPLWGFVMSKKPYDHKEVEPKWLKTWLDNDYFKAEVNKERETFSIALPPPNVTGELHMGHALSGTIQDVLIRYNRMKGKDVLWQIGTDHAGIGTQIVVEKDLRKKEGLGKYDIGREKFIERTMAWKDEYGNKILEQMKTLGFSPDYSRTRYTMDEHYAKAVLDTFIQYFNDGLIYRGTRLVNWCPKCLTSLSDLEIDKEACNKKLYEISYQIKDSDEVITVATTRPETMFGDTAVAINPTDERFTSLIEKVKAEPGSVLALIPFTGKEIPLVLDEHVKTDFGTGALKVTPAHDANDYEIGQRHNLEQVIIMDKKGAMMACPEVPETIQVKRVDKEGNESMEDFTLHGADRYKARDAIVNAPELKLVAVKEYEQEKDLHDRCGTEIEPYLSDQWYVDMKKLANIALKAEEEKRTQFIPERYRTIFRNWLENIQDWCISRQIWWGHRIPVFYYPEGAAGADAKDASFIDDEGKKNFYYAAHEARDASHNQDDDVLDTWFSSALWPFETMKDDPEIFNHYYPTSILATAREIINLWVSRMIYSSEYFEDTVPFKDILIHPVVQTPDGKRMSKSKGNAIDPLDMVEKYGADASRMWYASVGVYGTQDVRFPGKKDKKKGWTSDTFEQFRKFANKLHNATNFVTMQLGDDFKFAGLDAVKAETDADAWILKKFANAIKDVNEAYEKYDLNTAQKSIYEFLWFNFCDWYIELSKNNVTENTMQILFYILETSLRALHPIMPFVTEEIWQDLKASYGFDTEIHSKHNSICFADFPAAAEEFINLDDNNFDFVIEVIGSIRSSRQSLDIPWSKDLVLFIESDNPTELELLKSSADLIIGITKAAEINFGSGAPSPANTTLISDTKVIIPLAGLVDLDKLKNTLDNKMNKLKKDMAGLKARLDSPNFINNASPDKVEETKQQYNDLESQLQAYEKELLALA